MPADEPPNVTAPPTSPPVRPAAPPTRDTAGEPEEVAHYDDAVIGRAFRWSAIALVGLLVLGLGTILWLKHKPATKAARLVPLAAPQLPSAPKVVPPTLRFTDITREAGIAFVHNNGAYGDKLLPESMGGGAAFLDFDNDGDQDLFFVNSTWWPGHVPPDAKPTTHAFYANDGQGRFTDITAGSGLEVNMYGMGCAAGDFDNDGQVDLFVTGVYGNRLFRNLGGGKFADVTALAGVGGSGSDWSMSAAFLDYDNDGRLDLFIANYVQWSKAVDFEVGYSLVGVGRA